MNTELRSNPRGQRWLTGLLRSARGDHRRVDSQGGAPQNPRRSRPRVASVVTTVALLAGLVTSPDAAWSAPVLSGDLAPIFDVSPGDCTACTAQELDVLERGLGMLETEIRNRSVNGWACIAEASAARDMAWVTFEAYQAGAITEMRWRDSLRAKGRFAANLTDLAIETMLQDHREALSEQLGITILPESPLGIQVDIYASAQFARLFHAMGQGIWQADWLPLLEAGGGDSEVQFNPVVDAVLDLRWESRRDHDELIYFSTPYFQWRDAELARLTQLRNDFLVGGVPEARDLVFEDYYLAMGAEPWTVMGWGCGASAAEGFRQHALELTQGLQLLGAPEKRKGPFDQIDPFGGVVIITVDRGLRHRSRQEKPPKPPSGRFCALETTAWAERLELGSCDAPPAAYFKLCHPPEELNVEFRQKCGREPNPNPNPPTGPGGGTNPGPGPEPPPPPGPLPGPDCGNGCEPPLGDPWGPIDQLP